MKTFSGRKTTYAHGLKRRNSVKMGILSSCRLNAVCIKIPIPFFTKIKEKVLSFIWNHRRLGIAKVISSKKNNPRANTILDFKSYFRTVVRKRA